MITVEHLTKCYGDFVAVHDLSFEIGEGHVYGFLGPNGAGKSTTMNIMTGCLSATEGKVIIDGHDIFEEPEQAKRCIGYLPEIPPVYTNETPLEYLKFVGEAKGIRGKELHRQIEEVVEKVNIDQVKNRLISSLSKGYRQRVGIAQALLGNPKVIILDEPTVGLDPIQIIEIRELIRQLGQDHTVILSSHILSEVQAICEKVLIISKGHLVAYDAPEKLEQLMMASSGITLTVETTEEDVADSLKDIDKVTQWELTASDDTSVTVYIKVDGECIKDVCRHLFFSFAGKGKAILEMNSKKANLEDVFLELTDSQNESGAVTGDTVSQAVPDGQSESLVEKDQPEQGGNEEQAGLEDTQKQEVDEK